MTRKRKAKITLIIALLVVIIFLIYVILLRPAEIHEDRPVSCQEISIDDWREYKQGFSLKLPADWSYTKFSPIQGSDNISWFYAFGPSQDKLNIKIGLNATDKQAFVSDLSNLPGNYELISEMTAVINDKSGSSLILHSKRDNRQYKMYHIANGIYNYLILGPDSSSSFDSCQTEIFNKIIDTFQFPQRSGEGMVEFRD
jgi:hypothetical protein